MIVTLSEMMDQLALTTDAPAEDLALVGAKIAAAQGHVERLLGFAIEERYLSAPPPALKEAVMQLAAWWFENREAVSDSRALPFGVEDIVNEYKDWAF